MWFRGAWKREWIKTKEEPTPHETRLVRDLQTPTVFGSVRLSLDRPMFSDATSFDDLDDAQLATLLEQRGGFAGAASFDGDLAVWDHEIDFQPPSTPDTARLEQLSPTSVLDVALALRARHPPDQRMNGWVIPLDEQVERRPFTLLRSSQGEVVQLGTRCRPGAQCGRDSAHVHVAHAGVPFGSIKRSR